LIRDILVLPVIMVEEEEATIRDEVDGEVNAMDDARVVIDVEVLMVSSKSLSLVSNVRF
jgi:hypothetical protein